MITRFRNIEKVDTEISIIIHLEICIKYIHYVYIPFQVQKLYFVILYVKPFS